MCSILFSVTKRGASILEVVRASYDAVLILSFFQLITAYLSYVKNKGLTKSKIISTILERGKIEWPIFNFFLPCFPVWKMETPEKAAKAYNFLKAMCLQYTCISFTFSGLLIALIAITFVNGDPSKELIVKVSQI